MRKFTYSTAAFQDLEEIFDYIEKDNPRAAHRVWAELEAALAMLARRPLLGFSRPDWTAEPVRFWSVRSYVIVYRPDRKPLEVVRILHGARDVPRLV
jgi:plasmid stabilization system protein ParE